MTRTPLLIACAVLALLGPRASIAAQDKDDGEERRATAEAFVRHRAGPSGVIPDGALFDAWRRVSAMPHASFSFADPGWRSLGPTGLTLAQEAFGGVYAGEIKAGRLNTIAFHPANGRVAIVGTQGGVWHTSTGGHLWQPASDAACTMSISSVVYDPVTPSVAYALTGDANGFTQSGCGVLRSSDGGQSWTAPVNNPMIGAFGYELMVDRTTAGSVSSTRLLAATNRGLYVSTNSGASWNQVLNGFVTSVVQLPGQNGNVIYAARLNTSAFPNTTVWRSTTGGATWNQLPTPLSAGNIPARLTLAVSAAAPTRLWALAGSFQNRAFLGIYRWDELGQGWTTLPSAGLEINGDNYPYTIGRQMDYDQAFAIDPRDANRIWIAGVGAYFSADGGQSFRITAANVHVDWHSITFDPSDPDHMAAGTDGGFYVTFDGGRIWRASNNGLAIAQIYPGLSVHPAGHWLYAGLQDNNAIYYTGSTIWNNLSLLGDGGYTAIHPTNPGTIFVTHAFSNFITRRRGGGKEEIATNGIAQNDRGGLPRPIVMSPTTPTTLYFGTQRMYRTTDEGTTWVPMTPDVTRGSGLVTAIAVAPSNANVVYVGTDDGVILVTADGGLNWRQFVFATNRRFSKIVVDPADPAHALATATTLGAPHMTETRDGANTFNSGIGGGLPDIPVHTAFFVPGSSTLMVGTDYGVLQTSDNGASWTLGPPGMPATIVHDLTWASASGTIIASTFARGAWAIRPGATSTARRGDVDNDGQLTAQDALTIQQAIVGVHPPAGRVLYPNGDANCDTRLTSVDAMLVLRTAVGLATTGTCVGTQQRVAAARDLPEGGTTRQFAGLLP